MVALFVGTSMFSLYIGAFAAILASAVLIFGHYAKDKSILYFPLFSTLISVLFLAVAFITDETIFIKIQSSLFNISFAGILIFGWARNYPVMKLFFGRQFQLTHETWMKLSIRWGLFFVCLAIANEAAWRTFDDEGWVNIKVFVLAPATALFMASQIPLTLKGRVSKLSSEG
ncbi:MAG: septation protein IspZ [Alphaproteobacteria bacterium]|nr:septation protein IspZ [Alphaproteobacteria bacterium]